MKPLIPIRTLYFIANGDGGQHITVCYKKPRIVKKKSKVDPMNVERNLDSGENGNINKQIKTQA